MIVGGSIEEERSDLSQFLDNLLHKIAVVASNVFYTHKAEPKDAVKEMREKLGLK